MFDSVLHAQLLLIQQQQQAQQVQSLHVYYNLSDLGASPLTKDMMHRLIEILDIFEQSSSTSPIHLILDAILSTLLTICDQHAEALKQVVDQAVYFINNLQYIHVSL